MHRFASISQLESVIDFALSRGEFLLGVSKALPILSGLKVRGK